MQEEKVKKDEILLYQTDAGDIILPETYCGWDLEQFRLKVFGKPNTVVQNHPISQIKQIDEELYRKTKTVAFYTNQNYRSSTKRKFLIYSTMNFVPVEKLRKQYGDKAVANQTPDIEFEDNGEKIFGTVYRNGARNNWDSDYCDLRIEV